MADRLHIRVVGAMLEREPGKYLITQRSKTSSLPLLWEFPGGRVMEGESDERALVREIKGRLGLDILVSERASTMHHSYPGYEIEFSVFYCQLADPRATVSSARINDHRWVGLAEMGSFQFPDADARTLAKLLDLEN